MLFNTLELYNSAVSVAVNSNALQLLQTTCLSVQCTYTVTTGSYNLQLQESNDGNNWYNVGSASAVTATGGNMLKVDRAVSRYYRIAVLKTSGTIDTLLILAHTKGV